METKASFKKLVTAGGIVTLFFFTACAKSGLSDRDIRRDQIRSTAENKRKELEPVAGIYSGVLAQDSGSTKNVSLKLEIKDIPTAVEGQVDPIMTPVLAGFLRFNLSAGADESEYIGFSVDKAEFDPKRNRLDLVVKNESYKEVILGLDVTETELKGNWTAPSIAASGTIRLTRGNAEVTEGQELRGEYSGLMLRENNQHYQFSQLTLNTSFVPPNGLKVTAVLRVIFGEWTSSEYLTYHFNDVQFNPVSGQIVLKAEEADVSFLGQVGPGKITGDWHSNYTGKLGSAKFEKANSAPAAPVTGTLFEALRGTYQGKVTNTNPQSNLPERLQVSFVTSQDLSQPSGIKVTGTMRAYLGSFDSLEYIEIPLASIQYNFYTRQLVAKSSADFGLTLKGAVSPKRVDGKMFSDALGELGDVEVMKP